MKLLQARERGTLETYEYEYDSSGRLTEGSGKVERTTGGILRPNIVSYKSKYSYDTIGNILTKTQTVNGGESSLSCDDTYTYGGKQPHAVTKAGAMVFTYDDNGNMIKRENTETKNTMTLVWDDENRLIRTTDSLHTTDYRYDANGERIIKKSELGETQYVSANYIVRNKTVISKHVFAGNQRIASTVSMKNNCGTVTEQNTMYFHPDHLGSSSYVTDKKGNFFEMIEYLPYGETLYDEAATVDKTEFRFTSKEQDAETGLYYHGARYRDVKTGVWLSCDPYLANGNYFPVPPVNDKVRERNMKLPGMGGVYNSVNLNLYHYAGNNPVVMTDPDGNAFLFSVMPSQKILNTISWLFDNSKSFRNMYITLGKQNGVRGTPLVVVVKSGNLDDAKGMMKTFNATATSDMKVSVVSNDKNNISVKEHTIKKGTKIQVIEITIDEGKQSSPTDLLDTIAHECVHGSEAVKLGADSYNKAVKMDREATETTAKNGATQVLKELPRANK